MSEMYHTEFLAMGCDAEAKKLREAAESANKEYVEILTQENASEDLKALLKSEYEHATKMAAAAADTAQMAKRKLLGGNPNPAAEGSSAPAGEPDELDKELATLGKRKRKDLADIVRTVGAPIGGWFDKQGKFHVTHAELANRLNRQLERA